MELNMKLLIEDPIKQVREEIKQSREEIVVNFVTHSEAMNKRVSELAVVDKGHDERVTGLEIVAATFDKSFALGTRRWMTRSPPSSSNSSSLIPYSTEKRSSPLHPN
jgi:hypothetical protein